MEHKMGIQLSRSDQIILLRTCATEAEIISAKIDRVDFDDDLRTQAIDFSGAMENAVKDSCILSLQTPEEADECAQEAVYERDHRDMEISAYHSQCL